MIIGVPKEIKLQEHRIGLTPQSVKVLADRNHEVLVETNGGFEAGFTNDDYLKAGAKIIKTPEEIFKKYANSVVYIENQKDRGTGSGFIINHKGLKVITNWHVVETAKDVTICLKTLDLLLSTIRTTIRPTLRGRYSVKIYLSIFIVTKILISYSRHTSYSSNANGVRDSSYRANIKQPIILLLIQEVGAQLI
mgnify:CR=1 FL=1